MITIIFNCSTIPQKALEMGRNVLCPKYSASGQVEVLGVVTESFRKWHRQWDI